MKRPCDPNGIRTRVTAVKGRCPGPLDDRVIRQLRMGNIGIAVVSRKANWQPVLPASGTDALQPILALLGAKLVNQRRCARSCAAVRTQNLMRILDQSLSRFAIAQKLGECAFK